MGSCRLALLNLVTLKVIIECSISYNMLKKSTVHLLILQYMFLAIKLGPK